MDSCYKWVHVLHQHTIENTQPIINASATASVKYLHIHSGYYVYTGGVQSSLEKLNMIACIHLVLQIRDEDTIGRDGETFIYI